MNFPLRECWPATDARAWQSAPGKVFPQRFGWLPLVRLVRSRDCAVTCSVGKSGVFVSAERVAA